MPSRRSLSLIAISLASLSLAHDGPSQSLGNVAVAPEQTPQPALFEKLANALPADSLQSALHTHVHPKFQDGVYESAHSAVSRVHDENPSLASKVIEAAMAAGAKFDLIKRQSSGDNTTTTTTDENGGTVTTTTSTDDSARSSTPPPPPTSTSTTDNGGASTSNNPPPSTQSPSSSGDDSTSNAPPPASSSSTTTNNNRPPPASSSSSNTPVIVPIDSTSTDSRGSASVIRTSAVASATESVEVAETTTNDRGETVTTSRRVPAAVLTTTNAQGQTIRTTSPVSTFNPRPSSGQEYDITTTDRNGATVILSDVTSGEVVRTTDAQGHTFVTTFTPGGGRVSSVVLQTSTDSGGRRHTLTSFVSAETGAAGSDGDNGDSNGSGATASTRPSLQNGVPANKGAGQEVLVALGIGVLGAVALI